MLLRGCCCRHAGVQQSAPSMPWRYVITQNLVEDCGRHILSDFAGEAPE